VSETEGGVAAGPNPEPLLGYVLVIDNYDSFVYNIVQLLPPEVERIVVRRNDRISAAEAVADTNIRGVVISPGPMTPRDAGAASQVLVALAQEGVPGFGICLGHQCIADAFGARVEPHPVPTHGKKSLVRLLPDPIFEGLPDVIEAGRYHSLHVVDDGLGQRNLTVIARAVDDATVMGVRHATLPIVGVQFHPESILTGEPGRRILENFVQIVRAGPIRSSSRSVGLAG
jgi:anthranilate synthase/aminodeoxychorismate synthase-like glutamine amidotransferase